MRVKGNIKKQQVVILIDSGSTRNFIDSREAKRLGTTVYKYGNLNVTVENGVKLVSACCYKKVDISIQGLHISTDCYLLKLEGCQALGAHWLRTLGPILWDFSNLWMRFSLEGNTYQLKGETTRSLSAISPYRLRKIGEGQGAILQLCSIQSIPRPIFDLQIEKLLQKYGDIFEEPT